MLKERIDQAMGRKAVDLLIVNAKVLDVFNGEIFEAPVAVADGRVIGFTKLEAEQVYDAQGAYLLPGFIDGHVHMESSMLCPARFAELVLPFGTTTVVADPHEIANVTGLDGIAYMLEASSLLPLDVRIMLPSCVPALPMEEAGAVLNAAALAPLMSHPKVGGLGEMMNVPGVLGADADVLAKIESARAAGKVVDGHVPVLDGASLDAYSGAGISTNHECTTAADLHENLRRGMYTIVREGSATRDLLNLLPGITPLNARRCIFCTDDRQPVDILARGHINNNVRMAVAAGLDAVNAVRMASLNAAECYGLHHKGGIAPGWHADLVLVNNLTEFKVHAVWAAGKQVVEGGKLCMALPHSDPGKLRTTMRVAELRPEHLAVSVPSGIARVIKLQAHSVVTLATEQAVKTDSQGLFDFAQNPGMLKIAVIERHKASGHVGVGLMDANYGLRGGAIATSVSHDSHNIVVSGDNDADMVAAVQEVARMGGGIAMLAAGKVLATLPLPIGGLMSDANGEEVAQKLSALLALADSHYHISKKADAFITLSFMALTVIPELKISTRGLFDGRSFSFVSVDAHPQDKARV